MSYKSLQDIDLLENKILNVTEVQGSAYTESTNKDLKISTLNSGKIVIDSAGDIDVAGTNITETSTTHKISSKVNIVGTLLDIDSNTVTIDSTGSVSITTPTTNITSATNITGNTTITGTASITGATTVGSTLAVVGNTTIGTTSTPAGLTVHGSDSNPNKLSGTTEIEGTAVTVNGTTTNIGSATTSQINIKAAKIVEDLANATINISNASTVLVEAITSATVDSAAVTIGSDNKESITTIDGKTTNILTDTANLTNATSTAISSGNISIKSLDSNLDIESTNGGSIKAGSGNIGTITSSTITNNGNITATGTVQGDVISAVSELKTGQFSIVWDANKNSIVFKKS